jgi:hypothetical protein
MVVERCHSVSEYSDLLSMVVAKVGDHGLKGETALRKLLVGKQYYMNTDAFGTLLLQMHVFLGIKDLKSALGADPVTFFSG